MAGFNLGDILVNIKANTDGLSKGLNDVQQMGEKTKTLGEQVQHGMNVAAVGLAAVGTGLTIYAKKATDFTVDLVKQSTALGREIGVNTSEASRLSAAMQRMGIDTDKTQQMFGIFSKKINEAANMTEADRLAHESLSLQMRQTQRDIDDTTTEIKKNGDKTGELSLKVETLKNKLATLQDQSQASANAFEQLGISTQKADGTQKGFTEILGETADKFKAMPNGVTKTALALDLFGKSGKDMVKVLNLGSQGIDDLEKQADKLGLTLNVDTITRINKLIQSEKDLKEQTDAIKIAVGTATAPVLTEFNRKLSEVTLALLNAHGPISTVTTDVLAFGGPIANAASGMLAFLANVDQALPLLAGLGRGLTSIVGLLTSPWVLAFAGAALAIGIVADHFMNQTSEAQRLKSAQDNLVTATNSLKTAQDNLANSQLAVQGAQLGVEGAQRSYNQAVKAFGPNSYEARDALYNLKVAQQQLKDAQDRTKQSQDELHKSEQTVAKDRSLIDHLKETASNIQSVGDKAFSAGQQIQRINGSKVTVKTSANKAGVQTIDFVSTFGARAKGGPVTAGNPYVTGEEGEEIFIPETNGQIVPHNLSMSLVDGLINVSNMLRDFMSNGAQAFLGASQLMPASALGGQQVHMTTNIGTINIANQQDADYLLQRLDRDHQLESLGLSPRL